MLTHQNEEIPETFPPYVSNAGLDFWEPDQLYIEWIAFLYAIWEKVDYL
ncbi:MAG: hypothetical protein JW779_15625 [Candidatus Thorarchaeota archaeon]|nr:hypothetical protein [Candidatus Thorarchaeota archaeon]